MDSRSVGLLVIGLGAAAVVLGLLIWSGALGWFGRLPGDVRWEGENTRVYIPITSMLILSVVASLLLHLLRRFL
jgi:uncharacterized protein HemY